MDTVRILIIDDEKVIREGVERALSKEGTISKKLKTETGVWRF